MISDNGNSRIHLVGQTDDAKEKKRRGMNATVGEMEDYLVSKSEEIWEFYRAQIPPIIMQMLQGGFAAYDHGRRETFDEIMAPLSRDGLSPEVCNVLDALQQVFGMPKPDIAPAKERDPGADAIGGALAQMPNEIDPESVALHNRVELAVDPLCEVCGRPAYEHAVECV